MAPSEISPAVSNSPKDPLKLAWAGFPDLGRKLGEKNKTVDFHEIEIPVFLSRRWAIRPFVSCKEYLFFSDLKLKWAGFASFPPVSSLLCAGRFCALWTSFFSISPPWPREGRRRSPTVFPTDSGVLGKWFKFCEIFVLGPYGALGALYGRISKLAISIIGILAVFRPWKCPLEHRWGPKQKFHKIEITSRVPRIRYEIRSGTYNA